MTIIRGSDTAAFGGGAFLLKVTNNTSHPIVKAEWHCGKLIKDLGPNPEFPCSIQLTRQETLQLQNKNECYLYCWDENGKLYICPQKGTFNTLPERF